MAGGIDFDFTDLNRLAAQLGEVPDNAGENIRKAVQVTSINIKKAWQGKIEGSKSAPGGARSIGFDLGANARLFGGGSNQITSVIGAALGGAGSLVFINEFGALSTAPKASGAAALAENQEDFMRGLSKALEDAERQAGL
jgi:hypothetical protein